jgi:nitroreductase
MDIAPTRQLLPPQIDPNHPLLQILRDRKTSRKFDPRPLPDQVLSDLLWAANGVNRPETGGRTVPSALDWQEIDVYLATAEGLFRYDAQAHALDQISGQDQRALTGRQDFVSTAPVNLVYVADLARVQDVSPRVAELFMAEDAAMISGNVYLFCASEGLATVVRGMIDREPLARALGLRADQRIIMAQTVGYPLQTAG